MGNLLPHRRNVALVVLLYVGTTASTTYDSKECEPLKTASFQYICFAKAKSFKCRKYDFDEISFEVSN